MELDVGFVVFVFEQQLHNLEMIIQARFVQSCVSKLQASGRSGVGNVTRKSKRPKREATYVFKATPVYFQYRNNFNLRIVCFQK